MNSEANYVVEFTPAGRGAVAAVLVAGPRALFAVEQCFAAANKRRLADIPLQHIALGRWGGPDGEELIVCRRAEDRIEVHCHGGTAAVRAVVDRLVALGCTKLSWQEWTASAEGDPIRAAALVQLANAPTARTAAILYDQYSGALSAALREVCAAAVREHWPAATEMIDSLLAHVDIGTHVTTQWQVVLAGPPNAGKSSLMNALAGFQRTIVSEVPGTTRDVVALQTAIDGWPVQLSDTAGLREAGDSLEAAGIERASEAIENADLLVLVRDCSVRASDTLQSVNARDLPRQSHARTLEVLHKSDLLPVGTRDSAARPTQLFTSALTGDGISQLIDAIAATLVPNPPPAGAAVPFEPQHFAALDLARAAIDRRDAHGVCDALATMLPR